MSKQGEWPSTAFYIKAAHSGQVLQPMSVLKQEYCRIVTAKQQFGKKEAAHQLWRHEDGHIINVGSGLALDYEGGNFRKLGVISVCQWQRKTGSDAHNQKWLLREGGLIASHDDTTRVLDVRGESTAPGAEILLYKLKKGDAAESNNQRFILEVPMQ